MSSPCVWIRNSLFLISNSLDKPIPSALQSQTGFGDRIEGDETVKHDSLTTESNFFGKEKISRILLQIAPPVMLAQLIQALYNIVNSFFVGQYSANALTALSVIYPLQLIVVAMGVAGAALATVIGQLAAAVITGIRGYRRPPERRQMGHYAKQIYKLGYPSILMQALYTVYIVGLNMILAVFSDAAVTVLGLYYKLQTFFFIPLLGLQICIVPVISYIMPAMLTDAAEMR